jgi:predicted MFS family arabinose efflux permease
VEALARQNQPDGFDCPGCAWPDPKHTSAFEFCENGAKAVTWEATTKRVGPEFFDRYTVASLWGAVTATLPADLLLDWLGWLELFALFAGPTVVGAVMIYLIVPEAKPVASGVVSVGLRKVYADPRFWRLAPLSACCIGTAWALQGLWAAQWLEDVEGLDRAGVVFHLFAMAVALSLGAILLGVAADRLRKRGVGSELLGFVAAVFIATQFALILRLPLPSYLQ